MIEQLKGAVVPMDLPPRSLASNTRLPQGHYHFAGIGLEAVRFSGEKAVIYKGRFQDRPIAIKVSTASDGGQLRNEIGVNQVLQQSGNQEHLVEFLGYGEGIDPKGYPHGFMAMEYIPGGSVEEEISQTGQIQPDLVVSRARQVASGLQPAHTLGLVHRDIKPGNVLISEKGVKVSDWGIARPFGHWEKDYSMTENHWGFSSDSTGFIYGSACYMAPEQAKGATLGPTTDAYSLGLLTFEMFTGQSVRDRDIAPLQQVINVSDHEQHDAMVAGAAETLHLMGLQPFIVPIREVLDWDMDRRPDAMTLAVNLSNNLQEMRADRYYRAGSSLINS